MSDNEALMSNTNKQKAVSPHRVVLASADIAPSPDITKLIVGPFKVSERLRLSTRSKNVDPKGSLICNTARLDDGDHYNLVYLFQNYGTKKVTVTIRRAG